MTGDCHVRFCERLAGEIPACLLGRIQNYNLIKYEIVDVFAIQYIIGNM